MLANAQQGRFPRSHGRGRLHYHAHQALHRGKGLPVLCWLSSSPAIEHRMQTSFEGKRRVVN